MVRDNNYYRIHDLNANRVARVHAAPRRLLFLSFAEMTREGRARIFSRAGKRDREESAVEARINVLPGNHKR